MAFVICCASDTAEAGHRQALAVALLSQPETAKPEDAGCVSTDADTDRHIQISRCSSGLIWLLFQLLQLNHRSCLELTVSEWDDEEGSIQFRDYVCDLNVTNKVADRGVALMQSFANTVT